MLDYIEIGEASCHLYRISSSDLVETFYQGLEHHPSPLKEHVQYQHGDQMRH